MPSEFEGHFDRDREEWTARKHRILGQYIKVALAKFSLFKAPITLVDGFAGANQYGAEAIGSTLIMAEVATKSPCKSVAIHACERNPDTFAQLAKNTAVWNDQAKVSVHLHNGTHSEYVSLIRDRAKGPVIVFLNPERPTSFSISDDLLPWCQVRGASPVDVLGVFFPNAISRIASARLTPSTRKILKANLGDCPTGPISQQMALEIFEERCSSLKTYFGCYPLRKVSPNRIAYAIFGLSQSEHGYQLLSDSVARDFEGWESVAKKAQQPSLLDGVPEFDPRAQLWEDLKACAVPILTANRTLKAQQLALAIMKSSPNRSKYFGQFKESDYTLLRREVLESIGEDSGKEK